MTCEKNRGAIIEDKKEVRPNRYLEEQGEESASEYIMWTILLALGSGLPRLRCWKWRSLRGATWVYGYFTARLSDKGRLGWYAVMFKWDRRSTAIKKAVRLNRRWRAKDKAYMWYCQKAGVEFRSLRKLRKK